MTCAPAPPAISATPGDTLSGSGRYPAVDRTISNAIVGHRLPEGLLSVHAPGDPCELCDGARTFGFSRHLGEVFGLLPGARAS